MGPRLASTHAHTAGGGAFPRPLYPRRVIRRWPTIALPVFVVGLALHNAVMAALYSAGVRPAVLTAIAAWKEIVLAVALLTIAWAAWRRRALPFRFIWADWLALAFAALCVVYALIPQSALDGHAPARAVALALRHDVVPVGAYFLGRALVLTDVDWRRIGWLLLGVAGAVAAWGLIDVYAIPISWWRTNGVVAYFNDHLGYEYRGTGNLPENFIYNVGNNEPFLRRLVSTFLSPLASAYLFVVALLVAAARRRLALLLSVVAAAGLLWTFTRSALIALAVGLVVLGVLRRRPQELAGAVAVVVAAFAWAQLFPSLAPTGDWTKRDLVRQQQLAEQSPTGEFCAACGNEPSLRSHWNSLRGGFQTVVGHPQGYGLGNVGQTASRTGTPIMAGESNYTEIGAELGVLGALLWIAWVVAIFVGLVRARAVRFAAAFAAVLALAVQTDVIGDPWVAYSVWGLAGAALLKTRPQERLATDGVPA